MGCTTADDAVVYAYLVAALQKCSRAEGLWISATHLVSVWRAGARGRRRSPCDGYRKPLHTSVDALMPILMSLHVVLATSPAMSGGYHRIPTCRCCRLWEAECNASAALTVAHSPLAEGITSARPGLACHRIGCCVTEPNACKLFTYTYIHYAHLQAAWVGPDRPTFVTVTVINAESCTRSGWHCLQ